MAISFFSLIVFPPLSLHDLISDYLRMDTNEGERGKGLRGEKKAPENGNHQKQTGDTAERASSLLI